MSFFLYPVRLASNRTCRVCGMSCFYRYLCKNVIGNDKEKLPVLMYIHSVYLPYQNNRDAADGSSF